MDPQYICANCLHYGSPNTAQGICKRYSFIDIPKAPNDFCGEHSQYRKDLFGTSGRISEEKERKK